MTSRAIDALASDPTTAGAGETPASADPAEITAWMCAWIAKKLRIPALSLGPDSAFIDLGIDSLIAVELSGQLEQLLGRQVDPAAAWEYPTLGALAKALCAEQPSSPAAL